MLPVRPLPSGRLRWPLLPSTGRTQRRWARVHDVRFVATQGQFNPVLEKYRAKLDQKAKA